MVQQLFNEVQTLRDEIRRLRGEMNRLSIGGVVIPSQIQGTASVPPPVDGTIIIGNSTPAYERLPYFSIPPATGDLTIATGAITIAGSHYRVDTEAAAASDDLDTINGGVSGRLLIISPVSSARTIVIKHNTGNILCPGGTDITLDDAEDWIWLLYDFLASKWYAR